jgi:ADP-heptose:LPS heptosyltransferase
MRLKRLELWWRGLWIRILVRLMRRPEGGDRPVWGASPHRVLFLRHDRAGDMILSTGVMRAIALSHPTITMDVLASPANAAILDSAGYVADVIVFDKKRLASYLPAMRRLRRARYDAVIDCMVTAPSVTTLLLILASGARYRVGIAGRGNDSAFNVTVPPAPGTNAHMVDLLAALAPAFGVAAGIVERRPVLELTDDEGGRAELIWDRPRSIRRVLINISAGSTERLWPEEHYAAVMRRVAERAPGAVMRVIAAPSEADRGERIARAGGGTFVRTPSIRDAFALVATADLVVTPDTSITHAASAFRTPAVVLFVRGKAERWGLYDTPGVNVEHTEGTLSTLNADRVLRAVDEVLDDTIERGGVGDAALRQPR